MKKTKCNFTHEELYAFKAWLHGQYMFCTLSSGNIEFIPRWMIGVAGAQAFRLCRRKSDDAIYFSRAVMYGAPMFTIPAKTTTETIIRNGRTREITVKDKGTYETFSCIATAAKRFNKYADKNLF